MIVKKAQMTYPVFQVINKLASILVFDKLHNSVILCKYGNICPQNVVLVNASIPGDSLLSRRRMLASPCRPVQG